MLLFGGPLAVYLLWYTRGRDRPVGIVAEYITEPPSDLPAGVVGTLVDEKADVKDIIASIVDLARRGALRMEEEKKEGFLGIGSGRDYIFHLEDPSKATRPFREDPDRTHLWQARDAAPVRLAPEILYGHPRLAPAIVPGSGNRWLLPTQPRDHPAYLVRPGLCWLGRCRSDCLDPVGSPGGVFALGSLSGCGPGGGYGWFDDRRSSHAAQDTHWSRGGGQVAGF